MRTIKTHRLAYDQSMDTMPELNRRLRIEVLDEPGSGGACHRYRVGEDTDGESTMPWYVVKFQQGPMRDNGLNGVSNEALLAIVQDRLEGFQRGDFACEENERALGHVRDALTALRTRTFKRLERGVEGTSKL